MKTNWLTTVLLVTILVLCIGTQPVLADQVPPELQSLFEHHYIIFLNGVNSKSSENRIPLDGDFKPLQEALERKGISHFVYFSYSGTSLSNAGFCHGWGRDGCAEGTFGQLSSLNLSPQYSSADTHISVDLQADTLNWLLGEIIRVDPQAEVYLIGFSLGGIVSSHWATRVNLFDYSEHVKGIVLINSPVGGIPLAGPMLEGCSLTEFACQLWRGALLSIYGETVLAQLQMPVSNPEKSIIGKLSQAAQKFPMTSIQSAHDYTVNGELVPLCNNYLCTSHDEAPVGNGSQMWLGMKTLDDESLGGIGLAEGPIRFRLSLINLLQRNHNDTLQNDKAVEWAVEAVTGLPNQEIPPNGKHPHKYIIFLHGINSSSLQTDSPALGDFGNIEGRLREESISNFVYFSYAAATAIDRGELMCAGWGSTGCAGGPGNDLGDLSSLSLSPQYSAEDTKVDIGRQADALEWLIGQIIKKDSQAEIDLLGFSLGGIIATHWGSRSKGSAYYGYVHGIVTMGSPVGGIALAGPFLDGCNLTEISCQVWERKLRSRYGDVVGAQLQLPIDDPNASIIDDLRGILKNQHFLFASIQSTDDYTVNGKLFPLCKNLACTGADGVPIGYGSQLWPGHTHHNDQSLGGLGIPKSAKNLDEFETYLDENHKATLNHGLTAEWVLEVVLGVSPKEPEVPTITPVPSLEALGGFYIASSMGFAYDIVQPGESAHLIFQVLNSGQSAWSGSDFKFSPVPGSEYAHLSSVTLPKVVNPGESITFEVDIPDVAGNTLETVEYQVTYMGQPFEEVIRGYIFILPEQVKEIEDELRKTIDEWISKGEQELQDLINTIVQEIQKAIEREAKKAVDDLFRQCLPTNSVLVLGAVMTYVRRKHRNKR